MWLYNNKEITESDIPDGAVGFIYKIVNLNTGKFYIGRKLLTKASYRQVNGKKYKCRKESDWQTYNSSCAELQQDIILIGEKKIEKTIICFCQNKSILNYMEEKLQFEYRVLEDLNCYNSNIRSKYFKKTIFGKTPVIAKQGDIPVIKINKIKL